MTEQERIEEINSEQLATATDRVLLAARFGRARPSSQNLRLARASHASLASAQSATSHADGCAQPSGSPSPMRLAQGSQIAYLAHLSPSSAHDAQVPELARGSQPRLRYDLYVPQTDAPVYTPPQREVPRTPPARESSAEIHRASAARGGDDRTLFMRLPDYNAAWARFAPIALVISLCSVGAAIALLL